MEDTLRGIIIKHSERRVLILVLMEDTLRALIRQPSLASVSCLNPCFNGRYSQSIATKVTAYVRDVLILVLMEDTLREQRLVFLCLSSFDVCLPL